jgi:hypothetical protein
MIDLTWDKYIIFEQEAFESFWNTRLKENRNVVLIVGKGFDPRMYSAFQFLSTLDGPGRKDCILIPLPGFKDADNTDLHKKIEDNVQKIINISKRMKNGNSDIIDWTSKVEPEEISVARFAIEQNLTRNYQEILVDISSLPRRFVFSICYTLISFIREEKISDVNLHLIVSRNPEIDHSIESEIGEVPRPMHGFSSAIQAKSLEAHPKIWIPILGEHRENHIKQIAEYVKPADIYPVLPFPSQELRRADNLISEYYQILFDVLGVDYNNFILASDGNPFDLYRSLVEAACKIEEVLEPLEGCIIVISPLSSKFLTMGALLAALDLKWNDKYISVVYVNPVRYFLRDEEILQFNPSKEDLSSIWLWGEPYV